MDALQMRARCAALVALFVLAGTPPVRGDDLWTDLSAVAGRTIERVEGILARAPGLSSLRWTRGPTSASPQERTTGPVAYIIPVGADLVTNKGRTIQSFTCPVGPFVTEDQAQAYVRKIGLEGRVREVGPASQLYDCHGFTFAGSQRWISSGQVAKILEDNGYAPVDRPGMGDVVIYRDSEGRITHSGIVSAVDGRGLVTVTSKWGDMPLYEHRPQDVPPEYGKASYYRTSRVDDDRVRFQ